MIEYVFRPIDKWPRKFTTERKRLAPFHTRRHVPSSTGGSGYHVRAELPFERIVRDLALEVERHGADRVVIQLALQNAQIRRDGLPYATAKPDHPGVIVAFDGDAGPVSMPCDAFTDWKDNLRAISVTLEHLRGVDRYGVSTHGQQYRGWTALPPAPGAAVVMTSTEAAEFIAQHTFIGAQWILDTKDAFDQAYRNVAKKLHPDAGGDAERFKRLQDAATILRAHHGVTE